MPVRFRPSPSIPDHEVLRKIGGGSYGEVWLARGVTGALRAVKVVWREDFEDERGFEREFEGILKFEPISRDHPALVNILHVGRSPDTTSFYYYVMEIGDDVRTGRDINPIEYEPRTLRADHQHAAGVEWSTGECIDIGLRLAEALEHLHQMGLAHRDVKPSNIIFVNGKAKLADIGLVALRGQRTFVGTEGFVPPEGPGSAQADVYSLGKVLYEIATGMDRMNFPELPEQMPAGHDRKRWLELNRVICDVCEPRVSKRKISTASGLAEALRRIQRGKRHRQSGKSVWLTTLMLTGFACWAGWQAVKETEWAKRLVSDPALPPAKIGLLRVFSTPDGADVVNADGIVLGTTPTATMTAKVGEEVAFTLHKDGFKPLVIRRMVTIDAVSEPLTLYGEMQVFSPPQQDNPWVDHLGSSYQPDGDHHVSSGFVSREIWDRHVAATKPTGNKTEVLAYSQNGQPVDVVLTNSKAADAFCQWLLKSGIKAGFLTEDHEVKALREDPFDHPAMSDQARQDGLKPFRVLVQRIIYGKMLITSEPDGAEVYLDGQSVGLTHNGLTIPKVRPGQHVILLVLQGYKPLSKKIGVQEGETVEEHLVLKQNQSVVYGRPWENGIQMRFAPVGQELMVSRWETRVKDYALFVSETKHDAPATPPFPQAEDHPVVNVSREDAQEFCEWLTRRERKEERISQLDSYRLPTDYEWSLLAGLVEEEDTSPGWRDARKQRIFPWGPSWPTSGRVANFADLTAAGTAAVAIDRTIPGYDDGFPFTAPVGSFTANQYGLYDLSGNAQEWVSDEYSKLATNVLGVLRGGSWNTYQIENLYTGSRNAAPPTYQDATIGFRVVLAKSE